MRGRDKGRERDRVRVWMMMASEKETQKSPQKDNKASSPPQGTAWLSATWSRKKQKIVSFNNIDALNTHTPHTLTIPFFLY